MEEGNNKNIDFINRKTYLDEIADATDEINFVFVKIVGFLILLSIIIFTFTSNSIFQGLTFFIDAIAIVLAFVLFGGLIGFIFGIPKSLQNNNGNSVSNTKFITNTSLEQISDWLTKIIVGLGLVELREVFNLVKKLFKFYSSEIVCGSNCHEWAIYLTCLSIISLFFGFLTFYIYTRVNLSTMFFKKSYDEEKFKDEIVQNYKSGT